MAIATTNTAFLQRQFPSPAHPITDADTESLPIFNGSRLFNDGLYTNGSDSRNMNVVEPLYSDNLFSPLMSSTPNNTVLTYSFNTSQSNTLWQQNELFARHMIPVMVFVGLLMAIGLPGNCLVVYVFGFRFKSATQNVLIVCLACLDLAMCLVAMPTEIADMRFHHTFSSEFACKVLRFITMYVSIASCLTLISVAYDRHTRITRPLSRQMTPRAAKMWAVFNLFAALLISWPTFIMTGLKPSKTKIAGLYGKDCSYTEQFADSRYPLLFNCVLAVGFLISIAVLSVLYFRIWKAARSRKTNMAKRYTITSLSDSSHIDSKRDMVAADPPRDFLRLLRKHPSIDNTSVTIQNIIHPSNTDVFRNESPACSISTLDVVGGNEAPRLLTVNEVDGAKDLHRPFGGKTDVDKSQHCDTYMNEVKMFKQLRLYDGNKVSHVQSGGNQIQKNCLEHLDPDLLALDEHSNFQIICHENYKTYVPNYFFPPSFTNSSPNLCNAQCCSRNLSKFTTCTFPKNYERQQTSHSSHNDTERWHIGVDNNATFDSSFSSESDYHNISITSKVDNQENACLSASHDSFHFNEHEYSLPSYESQTSSLAKADDSVSYLELDVVKLSESAEADVLPCSTEFSRTSFESRDLNSSDGLYAYDAEITVDEEDRRVSVDMILDSFSHLIGPAIRPIDLSLCARDEQNQSPHESKASFTKEKNSMVSVTTGCRKYSVMMMGFNETGELRDFDGNERDTCSEHTRLSHVSEDFSLRSQNTHLTSVSCQSIHEDSNTSKREQTKTRCQSGSSREELNLPFPFPDKKRTFFIGSWDKTTVIALAVSCVFVLSFLPYLILMSIRGLDNRYYTNLDWTSLCIYQLFLRFYFLNSSSNPILYGLLNTNFRRECCAIWRLLVGCCREQVKADGV